jgi:hypothetical protein
MKRLGFVTAIMAVFALAMMSGCAKQATLAMKFNPSDTSTYKVITESGKDYKFEEFSAKKTKQEQTLTRIEFVYDQQIQGVDPSGTATALITIKEVKYLAKNPQGTTLDFDSKREADKNNALEHLIGQRYIIKVTPAGEVIGVEDVQNALDAVKGESTEQKVAQSLFSDDVIKRRHTIALPGKVEAVGKSWSIVKGGPAGMLMPKSFEKVYTLKEIKDEQGQRIAVITMEAKPSSVKAADMPKGEAQGMSFFSKMFDIKDTYNGEMLMNLSTGKINTYSEKLRSDCIAADPDNNTNPDKITMGFTSVYSIEKVK